MARLITSRIHVKGERRRQRLLIKRWSSRLSFAHNTVAGRNEACPFWENTFARSRASNYFRTFNYRETISPPSRPSTFIPIRRKMFFPCIIGRRILKIRSLSNMTSVQITLINDKYAHVTLVSYTRALTLMNVFSCWDNESIKIYRIYIARFAIYARVHSQKSTRKLN